MESISKGQTLIKEFLALVDESIKESNRCQFLKGLNNKTKLTFYKNFGGEVKFKRYLNGWVMQELVYFLNYFLERMDLMRSWVDIEVKKVCMCNLCGKDCESVGHFLWNCPVYLERRALFLEHLKII